MYQLHYEESFTGRYSGISVNTTHGALAEDMKVNVKVTAP